MQIETSFAAAIANAGNYAAVARKHGFAQTPADQVFCAMVELKEAGRAEGISDDEVYAIVDRYVIYDANGEPQPRPMGNVVPFRGR